MGRRTEVRAGRTRPLPPASLMDNEYTALAPAPEVLEWITREVLNEGGSIYNPDHRHILDADLQVLWANGGFAKQGRTVIGQTEQVMFRAGGWQKARQEQQMREWFGDTPTFLITFDGQYAQECTDTDWCALVEHELYHLAHLRDEFGAVSFTKDGLPKIGIQGHDVEEFVAVVRRYGVGDPNGAIAQLAAAARGTPEVSRSSIAGACGTCLLRAA